MFNKIDIEKWDRKEYFDHYYNNARCTYSVTANIDITEIYNAVTEKQMKLYPVLIWWIANTANKFVFMRYNHDKDGNIGYYDVVNPSFTYMPPNSERFHVLWCEYSQDLEEFYKKCVSVMENSDRKKMFPMDDMPSNCFDISSVPWIEFTSFNLNLYTSGTWLAPIITTGKLIKENGRVKLPFSLQVHHSVCDGYHAGQVYNSLQTMADDADMWIR
ncbi:MAG: type A chloramphenicol O-acetyltransferase [Oscillospiraceae bacterium]|nr:type A chloramphenicol O-acetyltransferase [Oscillospiraceae bacterium]